MSDTFPDFSTPNPNGGDDNLQPGIRILASSASRDLSFESPHAPESLRIGCAQPPQIDLNVELNAQSRDDGLYETELKLTARALRDEETVFHVELVYAGLFQIVAVASSAGPRTHPG